MCQHQQMQRGEKEKEWVQFPAHGSGVTKSWQGQKKTSNIAIKLWQPCQPNMKKAKVKTYNLAIKRCHCMSRFVDNCCHNKREAIIRQLTENRILSKEDKNHSEWRYRSKEERNQVYIYLVGKLTPGSRGLRTIWSTWKRLRLQVVLIKIRVNLLLRRAELLIEQIDQEK